VHCKLRCFNVGLYIIISLCVFLNGCLHSTQSKEKVVKAELPQAKQIIQDLTEESPNKQHPRLMAMSEDFERIKGQLKTDDNLRRWYNSVQIETRKLLQEPPVKYEIKDGLRLLPVSQIVLKRTISLSIMYRLTGDSKYANRAWEELSTVADNQKFPNWNPKHFLDTAEMTNAVAIGYDWLYDFLSVEQREILRKALIEKGLKPALEVYKGTANSSEITTFWKDGTSNWNTICNGGIGVGALAIADESSETKALAGEILQYALQSVKKSLSVYAPDGGMPEGPSYWNYATSYIAYFLSSLDSALGTDYGLSKMKGISETAYYPIYVKGTKGAFNMGDAGESDISTAPQMFWFSHKYKRPELAYFALKGNNRLNLIWYRKEKTQTSFIDDLPLDKHFINQDTSFVTMRSSWKSDAIFTGIHAGSNQVPHGDLDIGDFVLDALGIRWAYDLGSDNYNLSGYFDVNSKRWTYYRKRAEGQNTIVINPKNEPDQNINARATITDFSSNPQQGFTVIDMTSAYKGDALSVRRGLALTEKRKTVVLQDKLRLKVPSEVYWFMHTQAQIQISKDKKTAMLTMAGKRIYAHLPSPKEGEFMVVEAKPLSVTPNPALQNPNNGIRKLVVHLNGVTNVTLSVVFMLDSEEGRIPNYWSQPLDLDSWGTKGILNSK